MNENVLIKSERKKPIALSLLFPAVGVIIFLIYFINSINNYRSYYSTFDGWVELPLSEAIQTSLEADGGLFHFFLFIPILAVVGLVFYIIWSKIELTVTDKRVYGVAAFGKRVDLPLDSISAVGTSAFKGIDVGTSSGKIKFKFIKNRDEIHKIMSELLMERQKNEAGTSSEPVLNMNSSNADELKKFKELLDSGVITQEEFDTKKKQLLGL